MKRISGTTFALPYLVIVSIDILWLMNQSGDTPIFAALATILPWGFIYHPTGMADPLLPALNIAINTLLLYLFGYVIQQFIEKFKKNG